jgi:hypothetical protein
MTVRISELNELSVNLSQTDVLPVVDISASETKKIEIGNFLAIGISGAPSGFIDISKLDQNSAAKLSNNVLSDTGVASGIYGGADTVAQFIVNDKGVITSASGVAIEIAATKVTGLAPVATSGTYASLSGLPTLGTLSSQDAGSVVVSGGTISGVTFISGNVTISGGTISGITDLAIADGGTGASTASGARENLGLVIGTDVQPYSSALNQAAIAFDTANVFVYSSASGVIATGAVGAVGLQVISGSTASGIRSTIGLGSLAIQDASSVAISGGTISGATLSANNVTISGGSIVAITDLAIEDGGTGASTAADARTNLGLAIGSDVQAYSSALSNIATVASGGDLFFYTTSSGSVSSSTFSSAARDVVAATTISGMRDALGLGDLALLDILIVDSGSIADNAINTDAIIDGSVTTDKIADSAVSLIKIAPTSQSDVLIGRATAGSGTLEEIACTAAARSILDDASIEDIRATLGLGTLALQNGTFTGTSTGTNTGDQTIVLTGDVTGTGTGSFAATIADSAIVEAKIADGAISSTKVASGAITAENLADQSAAIVAADTPSASGAFIGQQWFNSNNGYEYTWTGSEWTQQAGVNTIAISGDTLYSFAVIYPDNYSSSIVPSLNTQAAGRVLIGPASGSDAAPTFRAIDGIDLPAATVSSKGAIIPGAGLSMAGDVLAHINTVASGTYYKVEVDGEGHVVSGATALEAVDIPDLDAAKITTGSIGSGIIADQAILATKLANYSTTKFGEAPPIADFIGQYFFNPLEKDLFLWDGNVWNPVGVSIGEIVFAGTYNASGNTVASTTSEGSAVGLTIGQPLPSASATFNRYYVVVESGGTGTSPAPEVTLAPPDIILCNGTAWVEIDVSSTYASQTASQIAFSPAANLASTNVQSALEEVSTECRNVNNVASGVLAISYGGTGQSSYAKGNILVASGTGGFAKLTVGSNGTVLTADSAETSGVKWAVPASGTVLSVNATAPLSVASGTTTPHITISDATTAAVGVVQLTNSTSTTSSTLAATATAVKSAYDLANAALPVAGGTMTGALNLGTSVNIVFEGSVNDGFETTLTVANPTADRTITLPNTTGTVITTGDSGTVTNTMLAGSIADTKLNTISTAGKVSNSATTATSVNTVSAIVARDASGNFSAGTISATIDDGTY